MADLTVSRSIRVSVRIPDEYLPHVQASVDAFYASTQQAARDLEARIAEVYPATGPVPKRPCGCKDK